MEIIKSYFNFKRKSETELIKEITFFKKKKLYRSALKITSENFTLSGKLFFWHLFFLLKLGKRAEFLRIFSTHTSGLSIRLFTLVYLKKKLKFFKIMLVRRLFFENPDSQVFTYIYANSLYERKYFRKSQIILLNFLNNKKILMSDVYCSYLMNLLAIKLERAINGVGAEDFTLSYKDNIEMYHEKTKK
jgi:hypothetical protein